MGKIATDDQLEHAGIERLYGFCKSVLISVGADEPTAAAATDAMLHGSRLGVDSHGVRLLPHYVQAFAGGRLNCRPKMRLARQIGVVANLDADHAHGARAAYHAMDHAVEIAQSHGLAAVSIRNSSHFGPAGAYALHAARQGLIGLAFCNSDSFVRLHDGASRFHGTNPIAMCVPAKGQKPWLLDMATSSITYNRIQLHRSLNAPLAENVASTETGMDTTDPDLATMLAPLGGIFGFKGAGLAGMVEIFSAVLSGSRLSHEILPMGGPDFSTPRNVGAFVMAMRPDAFLEQEEFDAAMHRYIEGLRSSPVRDGAKLFAPGDREWAEEAYREEHGVPIDPATEKAFRRLAAEYELPLPFQTEVME
ncbi:Ldh family oxidoreductase [Nitratireductor basaltis]|nr:Ldh family oxidoreductase [Nitratireductor basaltis]